MTRPLRRSKSAAPAVILFAAVLAAGGMTALSPYALGQDEAAPPRAARAPLVHYRVIEERNVFRTQSESAASPSAASPVEAALTTLETQRRTPKDLIVTGIMKIGGRFKAIIEKRDGSRSSTIRTGDVVDDYTVAAIDEAGVRLVRGDETLSVNLHVNEKGMQTPPAQAEAVPAQIKTDDAARLPAPAPSVLIQKIRMGQGGST